MSAAADRARLKSWLGTEIDTRSVAKFVEGPGISRLVLSFDIDKLRSTCTDLLAANAADNDVTGHTADGFGVMSLTSKPGSTIETKADQSGRYWLRTDEETEEAFEPLVDESDYSELVPEARGTYVETVHAELSERFTVGRMRLLSKASYNCNSWHRDPEPRVHIPIVSNPGSLFIVNHHCTHLPADGSVYFTDTRGYHTALNGGLDERIHLVAAIATTELPTNDT